MKSLLKQNFARFSFCGKYKPSCCSWDSTIKFMMGLLTFSSILNLIVSLRSEESELILSQRFQYILGFGMAICLIPIFALFKFKPRFQKSSPSIVAGFSLINIIVSYELCLFYNPEITSREFWIDHLTLLYYRVIPYLLFLSHSKNNFQQFVQIVILSYVFLRSIPSVLLECNLVLAVILNSALVVYLILQRKDNADNKKQQAQIEKEVNLRGGLLRNFPEGIMAFNKDKKPVFINKTMKEVLETTDTEEAVLQKIKDLNLHHIIQEVVKQGENINNQNSQTNSPIKMNSPLDSPERSPPFTFLDTYKMLSDKSSPTLNRLIKPRTSKIDLSVPSLYLDDLKHKRKLSRQMSDKESCDDFKFFGKEADPLESGSPKLRKLDLSRRKSDLTKNPSQDRSFKLKFESEKFKGHASSPTKVNGYTIFTLYGDLYKSSSHKIQSQYEESEYIALEIKFQETVIDGEAYSFLVISNILRREKLANLEESNKYKNLMFASISHEFRTPVNGVMGLLQTAMKELKDNEQIVQTHIQPAIDSASMLLLLIDDMLDYSKVLVDRLILSLDKFSVQECVEEVTNLMRTQANQKKLSLNIRLKEGVPRKIKSDKRRVQQILANLLTNAIKFTPRGGIEIVLDVVNYNSPSVKISVTDTGIGLKSADSNRLALNMNDAHLGRRVSTGSSGIGMGLIMSHSLALAIGPPDDVAPDVSGINVNSQFGRGSTFEFVVFNHEVMCTLEEEIVTIPTMPEEHSPQTKRSTIITAMSQPKSGLSHPTFAKSTSYSSSPAKSLVNFNKKAPKDGCACSKVLIVDDSVYNILVLQTLLRASGLKSDAVYDGQEAIDKVMEEHSKRKNCCKGYKTIFMDYNMPIMDGCEATCALRSKMDEKAIQEVPIIGCSAYADQDFIDRALSAGMQDFITKPVIPKVLEEVLKKFELSI